MQRKMRKTLTHTIKKQFVNRCVRSQTAYVWTVSIGGNGLVVYTWGLFPPVETSVSSNGNGLIVYMFWVKVLNV